MEWLEPKPGEKILDVGCGGGELSLKIAARGCQVYGIDLSKDSINHANDLAKKSKITAKFQVADVLSLPYPDGYFDKIVSSSCLEHFADDINSLKEMKRVLKPKGSVVLTTDSYLYLGMGNTGEKHKMLANVVNYYTADELKNRLEMSGIKLMERQYLLKSSVTEFFLRIGIKLSWGNWMYAESLIAYPVCSICERLSRREVGYTHIIKANRID